MSMYLTMEGHIEFSSQQALDEAVARLVAGG